MNVKETECFWLVIWGEVREEAGPKNCMSICVGGDLQYILGESKKGTKKRRKKERRRIKSDEPGDIRLLLNIWSIIYTCLPATHHTTHHPQTQASAAREPAPHVLWSKLRVFLCFLCSVCFSPAALRFSTLSSFLIS